MKNLILLFLLALFVFDLNAQSVTVTGTNPADIGVSASYTAEFTSSNSNQVVKEYIWTIFSNGTAASGPSGIVGMVDGSTITPNPYVVTSIQNSNTITVTWGDFINPCSDDVRVDVVFEENGTPSFISGRITVDINCVLTPIIAGPSSIQSCCNKKPSYCADAGEADTYAWTVTGGGSLAGSGNTRCIEVIPNNTGDITLTCVASRSSSASGYSRSSTTVITRHQPETSLIDPPSFICQDEPMEICIDEICGLTSVKWEIPNSLTIISGEDTDCIEVVPNSATADGSIVEIKARAIMSGGCTATTATHNIRVFSAETPPPPSGNVSIFFLEDYDPCKDENTYQPQFEAFNAYVNGITTITPGVVIDVPHHHVGDRIRVRICNKNLCSGEETCIGRTIFLPPPCERIVQQPSDDLFVSQAEPKSSIKTSNNVFADDFEVYPNPVMNKLNIHHSGTSNGIIHVFDLSGKIVHKTQIAENEQLQLDVSSLSNGIYYVQLKTDTEAQVKKVLIQR